MNSADDSPVPPYFSHWRGGDCELSGDFVTKSTNPCGEGEFGGNGNCGGDDECSGGGKCVGDGECSGRDKCGEDGEYGERATGGLMLILSSLRFLCKR